MNKLTKSFDFVSVATDIVLFAIDNKQLKILLIETKQTPYEQGYWAIPGGMVNPDESVDESACRHLLNKTGLENLYIEQLYTFGEVKRDPLGRVVSVAYLALLSDITQLKLKTSENYSDIAWHDTADLPKLAFDHQEIVQLALERLRAKLGYTNIVRGLLPEKFSLSDLQKIYEIILAEKIDKRNFRKKILALGLIKETGEMSGGACRPAKLYSFISQTAQIVEIL